MSKKHTGPKLSLSFRENIRDINIYNFLVNEIKYEQGISLYIKTLVEKDMKERELNKNKE